jgi:MATE family multidrug resistance protein
MRSKYSLNHNIWRLAWPLIISNISVPLLGLVDTAILGHLENAVYLAAVAVSGSILSFLYWGFGFLRMGTTGLAAQAYGANDHDQSRLILGQSILLALALGLLVVCFSPLLLQLGFSLVVPPEHARQAASSYAQIRIFSAPAVLLNYAIIGWLIGQQNTRWPLYITVFTNIINIALDLLLVIGLDMKSDGAAIATLIAEYSGCGLGLLLIRRLLTNSPGQLPSQRLWRWQEYRQLLLVNRHLFVRTLLLLASFAFFTAQGANQGAVILSANAIMMNFLLLTSFGLDGFAHAAEAMVGKAVGNRDFDQFKAICWYSCLWSLLTALLFSLLFWVAGEQLIGLLTSLPEVKSEAGRYLPWLIALPLIAVWSYLLDGIFIGATQSRAMQNSMLGAVLLVYLPCWYFSQPLGNHGLWLAFVSLNAARGLALAYCFVEYNKQQCWWSNRSQNQRQFTPPL